MDDILTISNYYDGPIEGITTLSGKPHFYECIFDELDDEYSDQFLLTPMSDAIYKIAMESWEMWIRYNTAFKDGAIDKRHHPVLPHERKKYDEIQNVLGEYIVNNKNLSTLKVGSFSHDNAKLPSQGKWQVEWC
jgi:hypothetical protein